MKRFFRITKRKNQVGEVSVIKQKSGTRTVLVTGRVNVPYLAKNLISLQSIINSIGKYFLHLFPTLLEQGQNKHISTYSIPEYKGKKTPRKDTLALEYELNYLVSSTAVNISTQEILDTVLNKNQVIGELLTKKINEELEFISCSSPDP